MKIKVFADKNNYRTHRVINNIKIDLQNLSGLVSPKLTAAQNNASLSNDVNISNERVTRNGCNVKEKRQR